MPRAPVFPPPGFTDLPTEAVPVPGWHTEILNERLADYEAHPDEGVTWEEFRAELQAEAKKP